MGLGCRERADEFGGHRGEAGGPLGFGEDGLGAVVDGEQDVGVFRVCWLNCGGVAFLL